MRKVTTQIKKAFENGKSLKVDNTITDGNAVWLHGNKIIEKRGGEIWVTLAGWNTPTTRERVNGITNAGFHQKDYTPFLNGRPCHSMEWYKISG